MQVYLTRQDCLNWVIWQNPRQANFALVFTIVVISLLWGGTQLLTKGWSAFNPIVSAPEKLWRAVRGHTPESVRADFEKLRTSKESALYGDLVHGLWLYHEKDKTGALVPRGLALGRGQAYFYTDKNGPATLRDVAFTPDKNGRVTMHYFEGKPGADIEKGRLFDSARGPLQVLMPDSPKGDAVWHRREKGSPAQVKLAMRNVDSNEFWRVFSWHPSGKKVTPAPAPKKKVVTDTKAPKAGSAKTVETKAVPVAKKEPTPQERLEERRAAHREKMARQAEQQAQRAEEQARSLAQRRDEIAQERQKRRLEREAEQAVRSVIN